MSRGTMLNVSMYYVTPPIAHRLPHKEGGQNNCTPPTRRECIQQNQSMPQSSQFWLTPSLYCYTVGHRYAGNRARAQGLITPRNFPQRQPRQRDREDHQASRQSSHINR